MGIRVSHFAGGAAGLAAYAAGRGKGRQRQQKYMMNLFRDQQRMQIKYGGGRRGSGGRKLLVQPEGTWVDPLAAIGDGEGAAGQRIQMKAQRRANERARRMGKEAPHPEADIQFKRAKTKEEIRRDQELADREHREAREDKRFAAQGRRAWKQTIIGNLPAVPKTLTDPIQRKHLMDLREGILKVLGSKEWDLRDPDTLEALDEALDEYQETIANHQEPSRSEKIKDDRAYRDDKTGEYFDEPGPGRTEWSVSRDEPAIKPPDKVDLGKTYRDRKAYVQYYEDEWKDKDGNIIPDKLAEVKRRAAEEFPGEEVVAEAGEEVSERVDPGSRTVGPFAAFDTEQPSTEVPKDLPEGTKEVVPGAYETPGGIMLRKKQPSEMATKTVTTTSKQPPEKAAAAEPAAPLPQKRRRGKQAVSMDSQGMRRGLNRSPVGSPEYLQENRQIRAALKGDKDAQRALTEKGINWLVKGEKRRRGKQAEPLARTEGREKSNRSPVGTPEYKRENELIRAAKKGDEEAQQALENKGIKWQV